MDESAAYETLNYTNRLLVERWFLVPLKLSIFWVSKGLVLLRDNKLRTFPSRMECFSKKGSLFHKARALAFLNVSGLLKAQLNQIVGKEGQVYIKSAKLVSIYKLSKGFFRHMNSNLKSVSTEDNICSFSISNEAFTPKLKYKQRRLDENLWWIKSYNKKLFWYWIFLTDWLSIHMWL